MKLVYRRHAIQRMQERRIGFDEVRTVAARGEVIESYLDDKPYPSRLLLGWSGKRNLHVVLADVSGTRETIVITVYEPDLAVWERASG